MPKYGIFKKVEDIIRRDDPREFPKLSGRLRKAPNNEVRYKIMNKHPHGKTLLLQKIDKPCKDEKISDDDRINGNAAFKEKDYAEACKKYTMSLLHAITLENLAVIYANRSAANFRLMKYSDSLKDVDRAFEHGYEEFYPHKVKLLDDRKGKCLQELGRPLEAIPKYKKSLKQYEQDINEDKCEELKDNIAICKSDLGVQRGAANIDLDEIKEDIYKMDFLGIEVREKIKKTFR